MHTARRIFDIRKCPRCGCALFPPSRGNKPDEMCGHCGLWIDWALMPVAVEAEDSSGDVGASLREYITPAAGETAVNIFKALFGERGGHYSPDEWYKLSSMFWSGWTEAIKCVMSDYHIGERKKRDVSNE